MRWIAIVAALGLLAGGMAFAQDGPTPLDRAVQAGSADPDRRAEFYELFYNSSVYAAIIPLGSDAAEDAFSGTARPDHLRAVFLAGRIDGVTVIEVFDSEARLNAFAEANGFGEYGILFVPIRDLLDAFSGDFRFHLNPGTTHQKLFTVAETQMLQQRRASSLQTIEVENRPVVPPQPPAPTGPFGVSQPPEYLVQVVSIALESHPEAEAAWLLHTGGATDEAPGDMMLVIAMSQTPEADALTAMVGEINGAIRGYTDGRRVQVAPVPAARAASLAPASVAPIYTR
ncbi:SseB family protein [Hyphobacterium marinum]|uniref:SseB family protein n=1 Tax=Hyphobacterium marinum TaxID=3116574 RepID=A0ABU7LXX8_9PROT|nr:SseB family protein [Hyphobacterium sp. Y6023]MEE2566379.1 SseB family protein [Hyphobacterium sp. Y6023]